MIKSKLMSAFYLIYGIVMIMVFMGILGFQKEKWITIPVICVLLLGLSLISKKVQEVNNIKKVEKKILLPGIIIIVAMQILVAILFRSDHSYGWDYDIILMLARQYVQTGTLQDATYLAVYPNNVLYFWLVVGIFKVTYMFMGTCSTIVLLLFNIFILDISLWGSYRLTKILFNEKVAGRFLGLSILFLPYWLYLPIAYTDLFAMPFFVFPLLFFAKYTKNNYQNNGYLIWISLFGILGYFFKGTPIIVTIAIVITLIMLNIPVTQKLLSVFSITAILLIGIFLLNIVMPKISLTTQQEIEANKTPIEYWLYTGLRDDGGWGPGSWNQGVVEELNQFTDYTEKKAAARQKITSQIKEYGLFGLINHIYKKETQVMWGNGDLNSLAYLLRSPRHDHAVHAVLDENTIIGDTVRLYADCYWKVVILLTIFALLVNGKRKYNGDASCVISLTAFGVFLFYVLWESNARYLVCNVFLILILAANGTMYIQDAFRKRK